MSSSAFFATAPRVFIALCCTLFFSGCGRHSHDHASGHDEKKSHAGHAHTHDAKHGGVTVVLGEEEFHIEFTVGDQPGTLLAYFFDGEMENYVRVSVPSFTAIAKAGGDSHTLVFNATANGATGETVGNSALFEARADWLAAKPAMKIAIPAITVKSRTYTDLSFDFPPEKSLQTKATP